MSLLFSLHFLDTGKSKRDLADNRQIYLDLLWYFFGVIYLLVFREQGVCMKKDEEQRKCISIGGEISVIMKFVLSFKPVRVPNAEYLHGIKFFP